MSVVVVNLIPILRRQAASRRLRLRRWTWGVIGYALLLVVAAGLCAAAMSAESDETSAALDTATRQIEELNRVAGSLRPQLTEAQTRLTVARTVGDQPDWSLLLALVGSCLDDEVVLGATKLEPTAAVAAPATRAAVKGSTRAEIIPQPDGFTLNLQGLAKSQAAVTQFVLRLERLGLFERVQLLNSSRQLQATRETSAFRVECVLRRSSASQAPSRAQANARADTEAR